MTTTSTVIEVNAAIDTDGIDRQTWTAHGLGPVAGFTATGDSFHTARHNFAEVVALAITNGVLHTGDATPDTVRVIAHTRKTFPIADLNQPTP